MNTKDIRQGRSYTAMELVAKLREIAQIGIVNANRDTTILRQAAGMMQYLAEYKINHLPSPTDRDYSLLLEECTNRGARIRELEKKLAEATSSGGRAATIRGCRPPYAENDPQDHFPGAAGPLRGRLDEEDDKTASGLIEED